MLDELERQLRMGGVFDGGNDQEKVRRATLARAMAEERRRRDYWSGLLDGGELADEPVTAYALARPDGIREVTEVLAAPAGRLAELYPASGPADRLAEALAGLDLRPVTVGATSVSFETTAGRLRELFGARLEVGVHPVIISPYDVVWQPYLRFARPVRDLPRRLAPFALLMEMEQPVTLAQSPPAVGYLHVGVAAPLRAVVNGAGLGAYQGQGVEIGLIDTGLALDHAYFAGYPAGQLDVTLLAGAAFERRDPWGHGTAMTAAALALAPSANIAMIKMPITNQRPALRRYATDAVIEVMSRSPAPRVVLCAWGIDENSPKPLPARLQMEIVTLGGRHDTLFVCAAGNGSHLHPANLAEVLAVGGAYRDAANDLFASDFTSSFSSSRYTGRHCPDVAGPSGPGPLGIYALVPTDEVSYYDVGQYGRGLAYPDGDMTQPGDGWCGMGGSSVAAAVVAGVAATVRAANPQLPAADTKDILMTTAEAIPFGRSADGHATHAGGRPAPWAGGMGMVNAQAALSEALRRRPARTGSY